jgi:hypothetical protein
MEMHILYRIAFAVMIGGAVGGCTSSSLAQMESLPVSGNDYIYRGINFGPERNEAFKTGVMDACRTADGDYTKDHERFENDISYRSGWEDGRLQCKGKNKQ